MKVSVAWLQKYFDKNLPKQAAIEDALTFHAFEIEESGAGFMDVKVLPDRAAYALSHRGIAREAGAALDLPVTADPLQEPLPEWPATDELTVAVEDPAACPLYLGALVKGVAVGPSPAWLKEALESVGQRSINNVVDATNYVMLNIGQPLHAFDAAKLDRADGAYGIRVRAAKPGECITTLSGEELTMPAGTLLITDALADRPIGIAGVKGGQAAGITEATTDIIIEAANFDGPRVRLAAQSLKLFTDASLRYQNKLAPRLAAYGMRDALALIQDIAGGTLAGVARAEGSLPVERLAPVSLTLERLNGILGSSFDGGEVASAFDRLGLSFVEEGDTFIVTPPFERRDLAIPEDLAEEAGRILGYDRVPAVPLPALGAAPELARFRGMERIKDFLVERGYTELSTPSFAAEGEIKLANPLQSDKPYLRASLLENLDDGLGRAAGVAPRTLGVEPSVRLFELGTAFRSGGECLLLALGVRALSGKAPAAAMLQEHLAALEQDLFGKHLSPRFALAGDRAEVDLSAVNLEKLGDGYALVRVALGPYRPFSVYPFALRDVAVWTPAGTEEDQVASAIAGAAGEHLARLDLFDRFEKEGRISYAYRLVFEARDRTLADADLDPAMAQVAAALSALPGCEVR